jgi:hypothetical protein
MVDVESVEAGQNSDESARPAPGARRAVETVSPGNRAWTYRADSHTLSRQGPGIGLDLDMPRGLVHFLYEGITRSAVWKPPATRGRERDRVPP